MTAKLTDAITVGTIVDIIHDMCPVLDAAARSTDRVAAMEGAWTDILVEVFRKHRHPIMDAEDIASVTIPLAVDRRTSRSIPSSQPFGWSSAVHFNDLVSLGDIANGLRASFIWARKTDDDGTLVRPDAAHAVDELWSHVIRAAEDARAESIEAFPVLNVMLTRVARTDG